MLKLAPEYAVLLSVLETASWLIKSTIPSSTRFRASRRDDQEQSPGGRGPRCEAMPGASCSPSSNLAEGELVPLAVKCPLEALEHVKVGTFSTAAAVDVGDVAVPPWSGAGDYGLRQDEGAAHRLVGIAEPVHSLLANRAFLVREPDEVLLRGSRVHSSDGPS